MPSGPFAPITTSESSTMIWSAYTLIIFGMLGLTLFYVYTTFHKNTENVAFAQRHAST